jgi:hypothetical protein
MDMFIGANIYGRFNCRDQGSRFPRRHDDLHSIEMMVVCLLQNHGNKEPFIATIT